MAPAITQESVLMALSGVKDPELGRDLTELGMVKQVAVREGAVHVTIELTTPACPLKGQIERDVRAALGARLPSISDVQVTFAAQVRGKPAPDKNDIPGVKNVIAVGSGKGGVGKSTVAATIAWGLRGYGASVGLMDADVYGPSVPVLLGINQRPEVTGDRIHPLDVHGLRVMSMGFLVAAEEAVIWRGPMLHGAMQQFIRGVVWGPLDYLIVDLPPTTGDVPLSLSQLLPLTGAVVVCTPQDVALADAIRAITMFRKLKVPVLGVVENMSHFDCPHCRERTDIFGSGGARVMAEREGIPFLGEIPINLQIRIQGDQGRIREVYNSDSPVRTYLLQVCEQLAARISVQNLGTRALPKLDLM
jgi:ATP-binding protein involved in chromosome partitioning